MTFTPSPRGRKAWLEERRQQRADDERWIALAKDIEKLSGADWCLYVGNATLHVGITIPLEDESNAFTVELTIHPDAVALVRIDPFAPPSIPEKAKEFGQQVQAALILLL
jgi:hypothetical protein